MDEDAEANPALIISPTPLPASSFPLDTSSLLALAGHPLHLPLNMPDSPLSQPKQLPFVPPGEDAARLRHPTSRGGSHTPQMKPRTPKPGTPPPAGDSTTPALQRSPEGGRALNVTDALSYLDAVKVQFQDKPEVYNRFLDIMKDFKSQVIDTPGVIQRVSRLFHGNPDLIQGFNTFLPFGYRIDISADPLDPNTITVTTPMGTTTQNTNALVQPRPVRDLTGISLPFPGADGLPVLGGSTHSRSMTPQSMHLAHGQNQPDPTYSPGLQNHQTTAAASVLGNLNNRNPVEKQPPGEFNHAIQYLNKIKARYSDDANTYKQFLDILQTYQKEQKHIQDSQVYVQVEHLFKDAPDLLEEFQDFLPQAVPGAVRNGVVILPQPSGAPSAPSMAWNQPDPLSSSPAEKAGKKPQPPVRRKKRNNEKEPTPVPPARIAPNRAKKVKHAHQPDTGSPSFSPYVDSHSPPLAPAHPHASQQPISQSSYHSQPQLSSHGSGYFSTTSPDKLYFFDRAKKSLENREIYEDFLKLLSLFSKEIIDVKNLIERSRVFLGDGELMTDFKELVGWDDRQENIENGPPGSIRTGPPEALSALPADDGEGPSYRRLPDSEIHLACSGRDQLCHSVLNDEWVSHPTWASEEAGFVAHKKNLFEEQLHKSEEERHEYHVQLEALARTMAVLEPLNSRIEGMTNEERTLFKLKPDFGGSSKTIYHRIIKKIYGGEIGLEVIKALQDCPSVAVPVVLSRLKQKDEEWRRIQREWNRAWREVDAKSFYKSLDPQGLNTKNHDRKNITTKHFVADIEAVKRQQMAARECDGIPSFSRGILEHQLEYCFHDTSVLHDSLKLVYSFLDRSQAQYSSQERRGVEKFLRAFIPILCMYPASEFNTMYGSLDGFPEEEPAQELNGCAPGSGVEGRAGGIPVNDLRKKLLKTVQEKPSRKDQKSSGSGISSRAISPTDRLPPNSLRLQDDDVKDIWINEDSLPRTSDSVMAAADRPFFANTTFYTLLRLLQLLYSRLSMCKDIGLELAAQKHAPLLANPIAIELGLDDANGPSAIITQTMSALGDHGASGAANVAYIYLLNACEKLFDGEMDNPTFEEHMRWFFGNRAYHLYSLDRVITALVKYVQTILSDNKCQEIWSLLQTIHCAEELSNQDVIRYRRAAENHVGQDDHLYRLQWIQDSKCIRVSILAADEPSLDTDGTSRGRWREYVHSYVMQHPTERVPTQKGRRNPVFLQR
ncbi:hypothetical protein BD779DRAFT_61530 [Infundibulicybe gibba]|nr:hypothetical protein BD779DRAFT_61530 [Infundibulicybe gibba]